MKKEEIQESQNVSFIGNEPEVKSTNRKFKSNNKQLLDFETQKFIINSTKNYNNMKNNMFMECSKICFNNLTTSELTIGEQNCLNNCQHKYFFSYALAEQFSNNIAKDLKGMGMNTSENLKLTKLLEGVHNKLV